MKYKIRRLLTCLIVILMCLMNFTNIIYATDIIGDNGGEGSSGIYNDPSFTWSLSQQGYRFTIVDRDGNRVSQSIDILYKYDMANINTIGNYTYAGIRGEQTRLAKDSIINKQLFIAGYNDAISRGWLPKETDEINLDGKSVSVGRMPSAIGENRNGVFAQGEAFQEWFLRGEQIG